MREDGLKWARHDEGDEAGKRGVSIILCGGEKVVAADLRSFEMLLKFKEGE